MLLDNIEVNSKVIFNTLFRSHSPAESLVCFSAAIVFSSYMFCFYCLFYLSIVILRFIFLFVYSSPPLGVSFLLEIMENIVFHSQQGCNMYTHKSNRQISFHPVGLEIINEVKLNPSEHRKTIQEDEKPTTIPSCNNSSCGSRLKRYVLQEIRSVISFA